ncbi:MAG: hypothetical protein JXM79_22560 [Sedimentisphaerales bacterium]|nr:hypothetical protein [Sedimentisphaerales bacterium]
MKKSRLFMVILMVLTVEAFSQPGPGDVFREYMWCKENGDAGGSLRVGGREGYEGSIVLEHDFDLKHATKAEVVIEKILCHDRTTGLAIQINESDWIYIPEPPTIPVPQSAYQHHFYPTVRIPLSCLKQGKDNTFRMKVDEKHPWKWPQNLIYGVHFRIYYDPEQKLHPAGRIINPKPDEAIGQSLTLTVDANSPNDEVKQVDYIGLYEDVNFEGDGIYRQWHYHFYHARIMHYIGSATNAPYEVAWDTSWVPDQKQSMQIAARIIDSTNLIYMTEAVDNLRFERPGCSVELCKPYDIPQRWVTRGGEKEERFDITGNLRKAVAAQLVWASWSPGYMNGIYINGTKVFDSEGPRYQYYAHRVTIEDVSCFKPGVNVLKTGKTPKINGKTVHGMEVNWPGIMVLIQYRDLQ